MTTSRAVASMAAATIASRIIGFARVIVVAAVLGTTALGNTFQSTNSISNVLFDLLAAGALSAALVPQLVRALNKSEIELNNVFSSVLTLVIVVLGSVSLIGVIFAPEIAEELFSRAPVETRADQINTGTILLRFFMPQILLYGIGALAIAVLIAKKKFVTTVLAPVGSSLVLIAFMGAFGVIHSSSSLNLSLSETVLLGIAGTAACFAFIAIPVVVAMKNGVRMVPRFSISEGARVLSTSFWAIGIQASAAIVLGASIYMGNNLDGAVVAYQLAFVFFLAPYAIISQSFSTVLLPDLSNAADLHNDRMDFELLVKKMMKYTYIPMAIVGSLCIALGKPLMVIASLGRASEGSELVALCFITLAAGILSYSVFQAVSRIYFAQGNVKKPALIIMMTSILVSVAALLISQQIHGNNLVLVMGMTHTVVYTLAAIALLIGLTIKKLAVWPDMTTWIVICSSIIYAVVGLYAESIVGPEGRMESTVYFLAYVFVTAVLAMTVTHFVLPRERRIEIMKSLRSKLKKVSQ